MIRVEVPKTEPEWAHRAYPIRFHNRAYRPFVLRRGGRVKGAERAFEAWQIRKRKKVR